jgi:hypothetical protein
MSVTRRRGEKAASCVRPGGYGSYVAPDDTNVQCLRIDALSRLLEIDPCGTRLELWRFTPIYRGGAPSFAPMHARKRGGSVSAPARCRVSIDRYALKHAVVGVVHDQLARLDAHGGQLSAPAAVSNTGAEPIVKASASAKRPRLSADVRIVLTSGCAAVRRPPAPPPAACDRDGARAPGPGVSS